MDTLGDRIRATRAELGITRPELSKLTGIGYSTIALIENGGIQSTTKLHILAVALQRSDTWLATGKGPKHRTSARTESGVREDDEPAYGLSPDEQIIVDIWRGLDKDGRKALQTVGHAIAKSKTVT